MCFVALSCPQTRAYITYNITLNGVSAYIQQPVHDTQTQPTDQHDVDAENRTQVHIDRIPCMVYGHK